MRTPAALAAGSVLAVALMQPSLAQSPVPAGTNPATVPPMGSAQPAPAAGNVAATVNGEVIRLDEVDSIIKRRSIASAPLTATQTRELRTIIAEGLIDDLLVKQYLRKHGPKIEQAEIDEHMRGLVEGLRRRGQSLAEYCRELGQTEQEIRERWISLAQFAKLVEREASPDRLKAFYEAYKDYFDRVEVRTSHIVIRVNPKAPPGERVAAREKLTRIRNEIQAGRITFADAARKHSFCPTAPNGGDLGYITRRDSIVDDALAQAAFTLPVGTISEPVETEYGIHLVQSLDRKPGQSTRYKQVEDFVKDCYAEDARRALTLKLRKDAVIQLSIP